MTDIAQPSNPVLVAEADAYAACVVFVKEYAGIDAVYQGWQNRSALPAGSNVYAVVSLLSSLPIHTPIERQIDDVSYEVSRENELLMQIDVCGENDYEARQKAQMLHLAASSSIGIQYFNALGLSCLYADDPRDLSFVGDATQFVRRYMTTLHLSSWSRFTVNYEWFDTAAARIENVDVHHPVL
jgi:hypothetical protein